MPNSLILINNGLVNRGETLSELSDMENVAVIDNSIERRGVNMIPVHLAFVEYIKKNQINSRYVLPLSSNQLFVKDGFFDYMKSYAGGMYERLVPKNVIDRMVNTSTILKDCVEKIGIENILYHSNHDSMFFLYEDFLEMMQLFSGYTTANADSDFDLHEEILYAGFLIKKRGFESMAQFKDYSYWNWQKSYRDLEDLQVCLDKNFYIIKRVERVYDNPCRIAIRTMGGY